MPYIEEEKRKEYVTNSILPTRGGIAVNLAFHAKNGGQLNYMISLAISEWIRLNGLNYKNCETIMGMLEIVKAEFVERVVIPYEKVKAKENGDNIYDWIDNLHSTED